MGGQMNLVGNSCVSSYINRDFLHVKYINPFCWCIMDFDSCYNLVKYWDELDFNNFDLIKDDNWMFSIVIDGKVTVQYVHYIFDKNASNLIKNPPDVRWNRIWEYICTKYIERIQKIKSEPPIFLFATANNGLSRHKPFTLEQQKKLANLDTEYKIICSFSDNIHDERLVSIDQDKTFNDNGIVFAKYIFEHIRGII